MNVYLDASTLVALFTNDPLSERADAILRESLPVLTVSDFAAAEFASAIGRLVRTGIVSREEAGTVFATFDAWTRQAAQPVETAAADVAAATLYLRRLDLNLRTPDALNIAIARRVGARLLTFDEKMAANARALGAPLAAP